MYLHSGLSSKSFLDQYEGEICIHKEFDLLWLNFSQKLIIQFGLFIFSRLSFVDWKKIIDFHYSNDINIDPVIYVYRFIHNICYRHSHTLIKTNTLKCSLIFRTAEQLSEECQAMDGLGLSLWFWLKVSAFKVGTNFSSQHAR